MAEKKSSRFKLNVGGELIETLTPTPWHSVSARSKVGSRCQDAEEEGNTAFVDSDPVAVEILMAVLRSGKLSVNWENLNKDLIDTVILEASRRGCLAELRKAAKPRRLNALDAERAVAVDMERGALTSVSAGPDGSAWVGHSCHVTAFDWALRRLSTTLTHLPSVDHLARLGPAVAVTGTPRHPGVHVYDLSTSRHVGTVSWSDPTDTRIYRTTVRSLATSPSDPTTVYSSFENGQRMDNAVLSIDGETLTAIREINRQSGGSTQTMVPNILQRVDSWNILIVASSNGGAFGYSGYIRLFDLRLAEPLIWDWKEPNPRGDIWGVDRDCFAHVAANEDLSSLFKVSVLKGTVAMADIRKLNRDDNPWLKLNEKNLMMAVKEGRDDSKLVANGRQMICSRGPDIEVWSEVLFEDSKLNWFTENSFRRNFVGQKSDHGEKSISSISVGGNKLFVARQDSRELEVWETRP